ncbi:MAG: hypothetical protein GXY34_14455 [Syntrophomonadaceae bacterium]|nr:hypothetical protein [Syntrophomonadaceae bacterium]
MSNVALGKNTYCSERIEPFNSGKAVDGQVSAQSRWLCKTVPGWLAVDLGAPYWINRWVIKHMGAIPCSAINGRWNSGPDYNMVAYKLQKSSDNSNWFDVDSVTDNLSSITDRSLTNPFQARYLRVLVTKGLRSNIGLAAIAEVEAYEMPPSSQYLRALAISSGVLTPSFSKNTYAYTANVTYDTASITVTATGEDSYSAITVNGNPVTSGQPSAPIDLAVGTNTITVHVTAGAGGAAQNYTITVTRPSSSYLTNLVVKSGKNTYPLNPPFSRTILQYTSDVGAAGSVTITPTAEDTYANIKVNGVVVASGSPSAQITLNTGDNPITVLISSVTGEGTTTYTVNARRASS